MVIVWIQSIGYVWSQCYEQSCVAARCFGSHICGTVDSRSLFFHCCSKFSLRNWWAEPIKAWCAVECTTRLFLCVFASVTTEASFYLAQTRVTRLYAVLMWTKTGDSECRDNRHCVSQTEHGNPTVFCYDVIVQIVSVSPSQYNSMAIQSVCNKANRDVTEA